MVSDVDSGPRPTGGRNLQAPRAKASVDIATIAGISVAFLLVIAAIVLGGSPDAFIDIKSVFIVVGGTFGVVVACFSLRDISTACKIVAQAVFHTARDPSAAAMHVLQIAEIARYQGVLALQQYLPGLASTGMFYRGITMAVDGTPADDIERIMQRELQSSAQRTARTVSVLRKAADISPAMGLIGTLVGLVQMLGNLEDPSTIGPSMAIALLTTFYGAILSNMVFTPLASKLERNSTEETLINTLYVMAASSIGRQENPRRLEMLLNTVLPPDHRVDYFG
jgi:chemotaxis protein MotA